LSKTAADGDVPGIFSIGNTNQKNEIIIFFKKNVYEYDCCTDII